MSLLGGHHMFDLSQTIRWMAAAIEDYFVSA